MDVETARLKAKEIVDQGSLLFLATSSPNGEPWVAALRYACDKDYDFYFHSFRTSLHARQITVNPNVAFTVVNVDGDIGVQIKGRATMVEPSGVPHAIKTYYEKRYPDAVERAKRYHPAEHFFKTSDERFFRLEIVSAYIKFPEDISHDRMEVKLK